MDLVKEYKKNTTFKSEKDLLESIKSVFMFGTIKSEYKCNSTIENKEEINQKFISLFEFLLANDLLKNKNEKLNVISLIDELNFRNEILELIKEKNNNHLKDTAERLGKKFMSSKK